MMQPQAANTGRLKVEFAQASDPGRDPNKQVNEDSCGYAETRFGHLCVLCDGMGGHYGGKEASRTAITTIFEVMEATPNTVSPVAALKAAIEEAGRRVYQLGGPPENRTRPGSTVVAMLLHDRGVDVGHVGDSRAYVIRAGQIYPLTRDHSMVQGMIDAGMLSEEQAIGHPDANKITRALGMRPDVDVEVRPEPMELFAGDILLQSSDGLTDLALGKDILGCTRQALASGPVSHACEQLVTLANNRGGHDNITVQMVRITDVGPKALTTIPQGPGGAVAQTPQPAAAMQGAAYPAGAPVAPLETVSMTSPDRAAQSAYPQPGRGGPPQVAPQAPIAMAWAPPNAGPHQGSQVQPTAMGAPGPTMNEMPPASQPWSSGMYNGQPVHASHAQGPALSPPPPSALGAYHVDAGAGGLQLPPASVRPGYNGPGPTQGPGMAPYGGGTPVPYNSMPPSITGGGQPARGGIVFVIIGLSAVVAVLILVVVWAIWLR
jgi:protein phosphatase